MKRVAATVAVIICALSLSACQSPTERMIEGITGKNPHFKPYKQSKKSKKHMKHSGVKKRAAKN